MTLLPVVKVLVLIAVVILDKAYVSGTTNRQLFLKDPQTASVPIEFSSRHFLADGSSGYVYRIREKTSKKLFALKRISKLDIAARPGRMGLLMGEISIHSSLPSHPNIVSFERWYENERFFHLATEFCIGGDLYNKIGTTRNGLEEFVAKGYAYQIGLGIKHLHDHGIVHRDLKSENIFLNEWDVPKIGDFGFATVVNDNIPPLTDVMGTITHVAPEVWEDKPYSFPVDIWAFGIICFDMLFKNLPFDSENDEILILLVRRGNFLFPRHKPVSGEFRDFIKSLLVRDDAKRPDINSVLAHPWFDDVRNAVESTPTEAVEAKASGGDFVEGTAVEDISAGMRDNMKISPGSSQETSASVG